MMIRLLLLAVALQSALPAQTVAIDQVSWIAGHWIGAGTDDVSEEIWLPPTADAMVGVWRWAAKGQMRLYEMLTIAKEGGTIVMRLRHFRPDLHGLEEKDAPFVMPAVRVGHREVVFEGTGSGGLLRITYRQPSSDALEAVLERGAQAPEKFTYRRK